MADPYVFSYNAWVTRFPEFSAVSAGLAQMFFNEAAIVWRNNGTSPCTNQSGAQPIIMNLLTAHIAALYAQSQNMAAPGEPQDANTPVGRISNASEGSVSVATDLGVNPSPNATQAWLNQTKYGFQAWSMMSTYRTMRYVPGMLQPGGLGWPSMQPFGPGGFWNVRR